MTGREEMDIRNEKWIANKLETCPKILSDYILSVGKAIDRVKLYI